MSENKEASGVVSFTGVRRERKTTFAIKLKDLLAQWIITLGGIGTILAVMTVCLFLVAIVYPLFTPAHVQEDNSLKIQSRQGETRFINMDEHLTLSSAMYENGDIDVFKLDGGEKLETKSIFPDDVKITSFAMTNTTINNVDDFPFEGAFIFVAGYEDGRIQFGYLRYNTEFIKPRDIPVTDREYLKDERESNPEKRQPTVKFGEGIVERTPIGQYRKKSLEVGFIGRPIRAFGGPVKKINILFAAGMPRILAYAKPKDAEEGADEIIQLSSVDISRTMTGRVRARLLRSVELPNPDKATNPDHLFLTGDGLYALAIWNDGTTYRYRTSVIANQIDMPGVTYLAEKLNLLEKFPGSQITMAGMLVGNNTLIVGDQKGRVLGYFVMPPIETDRFDRVVNPVSPEKSANIIWVFDHYSTGSLLMSAGIEPENPVVAEYPKGADTREFAFASDKESTLKRIQSYELGADAAYLGLVKDLQTKDLGTAVTSMGISGNSRLLVIGYADGRYKVFQVTSNVKLAGGHGKIDSGRSIQSLYMSTKNNYILASTDQEIKGWYFDAGHHEATIASMFLPVHYEGRSEPTVRWESTASDDQEPQIGFLVLIFGSLKATFYALLFGAPIALLAALFTSEFLHPKVKLRIKPLIEMMASLPSVVLGFLAALVFAQNVETILPQVLGMFVTIPLIFMFMALTWQVLPYPIQIRLREIRFFIMLALGVPTGAVLSLGLGNLSLGFNELGFIDFFFSNLLAGLGPVGDILIGGVGRALENLLVNGDIKEWLSRRTDTEIFGMNAGGLGGWIVILMPLSIFITMLLMIMVANPMLRNLTMNMQRQMVAVIEYIKFVVAVLVTLCIAFGLGLILVLIGFDPRGSVIDTYIQRNALIVGIVMGFAIIPIIYTISEDALSTVPDHLRSASLGSGATPWQTAIRIVIPVGMSGLFSAMMIGLGRAVGETMIMLMATGNTAIWDVNQWNIFNGFRTLAANIATELPEAPKGEWHYRVLFLNALVLFCMTLVINTVAEFIRQRFRKRSGGL